VRRRLFMCQTNKAGLGIDISKHGAEVRVGSMVVLDNEQVDASMHDGQFRRRSGG
jgi:hypothetical protein